MFKSVFTFSLLLFSSVIHSEINNAKLLCIPSAAGGVAFYNGKWVGTEFASETKYIANLENGQLVSVKEFGEPVVSLKDCNGLPNVNSMACRNNFTMFRLQLSNMRFVYVDSTGFTTELEDNGLPFPSTAVTPNISVGSCEMI